MDTVEVCLFVIVAKAILKNQFSPSIPMSHWLPRPTVVVLQYYVLQKSFRMKYVREILLYKMVGLAIHQIDI